MTTPKGASVVSLVLAVFGVFAPFLTGLWVALILAAGMVAVIVWLYFAEARDIAAKGTGQARLAVPAIAIAIIAGVALYSVSVVGNRAHEQRALTMDDLDNAMERLSAKQTTAKPQPQHMPIREAPPRPIRIVVEDHSERSPVSAPSVSQAAPARKMPTVVESDSLREYMAKLNRDSACFKQQMEFTSGLNRLSARAVRIQNDYAYNVDDKKIVTDLGTWKTDAEAYFKKYQQQLPSFEIVRLANSTEKVSTFLGIHNSGYRAWNELDAKRKAMDAVYQDVAQRPCLELFPQSPNGAEPATSD